MSDHPAPMPAIFFGHGNPMNALGGRFAEAWQDIGANLPRPKAVLMVSAHWHVDETAVTTAEWPRTIHDFYGFPERLSAMEYPAPGAPWLADRVAKLLAPTPVGRDLAWGLDHGTWSVLAHVFPAADIPVAQLSIDRTRPAAFHYDLGRRLAPLRDEGVLIAASGDVVHNLRAANLRGGIPPYDWALRFNDAVKAAIVSGDHAALTDYASLGPDALASIPTDEHYLPLLYVLGAQRPGDEASFFNDEIDAASVSMLGVTLAPRR